MSMEFNPNNRDTHFLKTLKTISINCRTIRIAKKMSTEDLSIRASLDLKTIYNLESGVENIKLETLFKVCYALEVNLVVLLSE
jgi:DNA-binding Xre family transcriptional regulator